MKKIVVALAVVVLGSATLAFSAGWEDVSRGNTRLRSVLIDPQDPRIIYLGSRRGVLKSQDSGLSWRSVLSVWGQNKAVNLLLFGLQDKKSIYAVTQNGLYFSLDSGSNWERVFQGRGYLERDCTAFAISPEVMYLGTKAGLFISKDQGRSWQKEKGATGKCSILSIVYGGSCVYVASVEGVFKASGEDWEKIFVAQAREEQEVVDGEKIVDYGEEESLSIVRYLTIDPNNPQHLYLATAHGVYETSNGGKDWSVLPDSGLASENVSFVLVSGRSGLYVISKSRIFRYSGHRWEELSFGLPAEGVNYLSFDNRDTLYAASRKGLFRADKQYISDYRRGNVPEVYSKDEPEISDVQRVAIKYAEVEPQKITRWRKQAAKRAWFPQLNASVGRNITDLWHWESGSSTKSGDDVLIKGNDAVEWDVSLSWDLGKIIWSEDQTAIDVRSRLTVQLRDDILDEVNKIYFERLRVKMELDNLSIEDRRKRHEKELRLRELTASLDGLTGGYFSQQIKARAAG